MKYFLTGSIITIITLIVLFGYRQNIFSSSTLPYDDEQKNLDAQITIKFSHVVAENTPKGKAAEKFATLVEEKSNGRIHVQVYPNGILYNDENEVQALQKNDVQMIAPTVSKMTSELPNWQVLDLPYVLKNEDDIWKVLNGQLSKELLLELDSINIKGLTFWNNGFKQIASTTPIHNVDDFKNKKVRLMPSEVLSKQMELLGATPVATSFGDVFSNLQNNVVDAQENTISNIYSKKFYTMENNITLSNHGILAYSVMMNEDFWNSLDKENQEIINEALAEMQHWQFDEAKQFNTDNLNKLLNTPNVTIIELDQEEQAKWNEKLNGIYDFYEKNVNNHYLKVLYEELNADQ